MAKDPLEWHPTPAPFTRFLFDRVKIRGVIFSPCAGDGAIEKAADVCPDGTPTRRWISNDLDKRWPADYHEDASKPELWSSVVDDNPDGIDWVIDNPAFSIAMPLINIARQVAKVGVAMHLRASIHEVTKTGERQTWMYANPPNGILWLPRFAFTRSPTTNQWTTDSVCTCWVIWLKDAAPQFIDYAPPTLLDDLDKMTPAYRNWVDTMQALRNKGE